MSSNMTSRFVNLSAARSAGQFIPNPIEHATGLEKYKLLATQAGNEDIFFRNAVGRAKGTTAEPTIINAIYNFRMMGCVCNKETPTSRCECG